MGTTFMQGLAKKVASAVGLGGPQTCINKLTLAKVASFEDAVDIPLKKFNFIYGLNGTGKTTISGFLADPANPRYGKCAIDWVDPDNKPQVLVYNHDFVERNFVETHLQKGIFTLDQDNTEALNAIKAAEDEIQSVETQKQPVSASLKTLQEESERATNQLKDAIWKHKERFERTALEDCMTGFMGSKDKFLQKVMGSSASALAKEDILARFTKIQEEMVALKSAGLQRKPPYSLLQPDAGSIEGNTIFQEKIVGSTDSYMADIIAHLNHDSWVNEGIEHYLDKTDDCPFCKQHMDEGLKDRIRAHLDTTYKTKVAALKRHQAAYQGQISAINTWASLCREDADLVKDTNLVHQLDTLQRALEANLAHIDSKVKDSSALVNLESTAPFVQTINEIITAKNIEIAEFNTKVDNKAASIQTIKDEFWHLVRKECEEIIQAHAQAEEARGIKRKEIQDEQNGLTAKITALRKTIEENQGKTKNVEEAIAWINSQLAHLGLEGFSIQKLTKDNLTFYQIKRPNQTGDSVFNTLSEGEKTLISFLYFVKLCRGSDDTKGSGPLDNRMVVIDDPISSLSFNLVFDVSCLIWRTFMSPEAKYKQVVVLTHHLYFLHEMFIQVQPNHGNQLGKEYGLFRLVKNQRTQIEPMERKTILNTYQAHWQTLRDIKEGKVARVVLPNTMRNIIEYYFSFVRGQAKLKDVYNEMKAKYPDSSFSAFERYMNRESHSDSINITDMKEINVDHFMAYFKEVFVLSNFGSHYDSMMAEEGEVIELIGQAAA